MDQIAIAVTGAFAAWLSQERREHWRRWACIFGIVGIPFWFLASWRAEQWGIFAVTALYAMAWLRDVWVHWIRPVPELRGGED